MERGKQEEDIMRTTKQSSKKLIKQKKVKSYKESKPLKKEVEEKRTK